MVGVTPARRGYEPHAATILSGEKQIAVAAYDKAIRKALSARSSVARCSGNKCKRLIGSEPHLRACGIADWTARYVNMKRVRDEPVLARAIEE